MQLIAEAEIQAGICLVLLALAYCELLPTTRANLNGRVINVLDSFAWNVGSDGGLDHSPPRFWSLALTVDF